MEKWIKEIKRFPFSQFLKETYKLRLFIPNLQNKKELYLVLEKRDDEWITIHDNGQVSNFLNKEGLEDSSVMDVILTTMANKFWFQWNQNKLQVIVPNNNVKIVQNILLMAYFVLVVTFIVFLLKKGKKIYDKRLKKYIDKGRNMKLVNMLEDKLVNFGFIGLEQFVSRLLLFPGIFIRRAINDEK